MRIMLTNIHERTVCSPDGTQLQPGEQQLVEMTKDNYERCKNWIHITAREVRATSTRSKSSQDQDESTKGADKDGLQ